MVCVGKPLPRNFFFPMVLGMLGHSGNFFIHHGSDGEYLGDMGAVRSFLEGLKCPRFQRSHCDVHTSRHVYLNKVVGMKIVERNS